VLISTPRRWCLQGELALVYRTSKQPSSSSAVHCTRSGEYGIRVNCIAPGQSHGITNYDSNQSFGSPSHCSEWEGRTTWHAVFLASERSAQITES